MPNPAFDALATACRLRDEPGTSPDGLPERYLYSRDMTYRYARGLGCAGRVSWQVGNRRQTLSRRSMPRPNQRARTPPSLVRVWAIRRSRPYCHLHRAGGAGAHDRTTA